MEIKPFVLYICLTHDMVVFLDYNVLFPFCKCSTDNGVLEQTGFIVLKFCPYSAFRNSLPLPADIFRRGQRALFVTPIQFVCRGIREKSGNAVLIKLNQIGTVTETIDTIALRRKAGWGYVIFHRSGETEDAFIADFAVSMGGGQIKTVFACRCEWIAKYNHLLEIETELGCAAEFGKPFRRQ